MSGVLILGAGGHGKVIADILCCRGIPVMGFLDDNPATWGAMRLGLPVLGGIATWHEHMPGGLIVGIGDIAARKAVVERLGSDARALWCNAIHPHATVAQSAQRGCGIAVMAGVVVNPDAILGDHSIVNTGATVDHDCVIGEYAHIGPGAHLAGGIRVGHEALIGIGANIMPWLTIGDGAVVGAGSVVIGDVPSQVMVKGVPAR
ncbi:MAG: acetyltransferase [Thermomicrobia bacterium]|nr:acetyltransferase [Thermomicrobia bacterium]MCA1724975.1 acetyltransferase [Thermomicrobia bacterium]